MSSFSAAEQIKNLQKQYPKMVIVESDNKKIRLRGEVTIYRCAKGFTLNKTYLLEVVVPLNNELPYVIDVGNAVASEYIHRYSDGKLCLETDAAIKLRFIDGLDLCSWMEEYVEPYYFSYEYHKRFGMFPFDERPHGIGGILDTYQEVLHCSDPPITFKLICYALKEKYRGHHICPCGSGKKLRLCHGQYLYPFMTSDSYRRIMNDDYQTIMEVLKIDQTGKYRSKAK